MTQTLELLEHRTESLRSIRGIVRTMKTMSAVNAQPYEQAASSIAACREIILLGLQAFIHAHGPLPQEAPGDALPVIVALGSDHGLCGNYNELLAMEVTRHPAAASAHLLCVGARLEDALNGYVLTPEPALLPPANADGLGRLAGTLVTRLDSIQSDSDINSLEVTLVFTQREDHGRQAPVSIRLLPVDPDLLDELARKPWSSRSLPQYTSPAGQLFAVLIRNLLFTDIYSASAEALVTENAARLERMQRAEQSVNDRLDELQLETHTVRQSEITAELLDVIIGFEAMKNRRAPG